MCGRFVLGAVRAEWSRELAEIFASFHPETEPSIQWPPKLPEERPRYNIAPTQSIWAVAQSESRLKASQLRWGLVPSWAEDVSIGAKMINARGETVQQKPAFRSAFAKRRCVIPADGYIEWTGRSGDKQPHLIARPGRQPFWMAGLWERNTQAAGDAGEIRSATVITTAANDALRSIHDRMPVILDARQAVQWIDLQTDADQAAALIGAAPNDFLESTEISRRVNSVRHDDPECLDPTS